MEKHEIEKIEKAMDFFGYLCSRWQDEREYEDISEYQEAMQKRLPEGATITKFTKRPFKVYFTFKNQNLSIGVKRNQIFCMTEPTKSQKQ